MRARLFGGPLHDEEVAWDGRPHLYLRAGYDQNVVYRATRAPIPGLPGHLDYYAPREPRRREYEAVLRVTDDYMALGDGATEYLREQLAGAAGQALAKLALDPAAAMRHLAVEAYERPGHLDPYRKNPAYRSFVVVVSCDGLEPTAAPAWFDNSTQRELEQGRRAIGA